MKIQISVCICTRNRPEELVKAIQSIQKSTYPVHEIIVSDDSTDSRTKDILVDFPDVIYVQGPRKGLCANRNNSLNQATGTYVMFMDDDVIMRENFIESITGALSTTCIIKILLSVELNLITENMCIPKSKHFRFSTETVQR